jgi:NAD(P)H-dependent FMN reductase
VIDPAPLGLPARHEREEGAGLVALYQHLGQAKAFVAVTLEYNHSFPPVLKFLIASVHDQW